MHVRKMTQGEEGAALPLPRDPVSDTPGHPHPGGVPGISACHPPEYSGGFRRALAV